MNGLLKQTRASPQFEISVAVGHSLEDIDQNLALVKLAGQFQHPICDYSTKLCFL